MTKTKLADDAPVDPDDELLVAYLDGELGRIDRGELESRLIDEEDLRTRLQKLQQGWDLLDEMDGPAPSQRLVASTLQLVVTDVLQPSPSRTATILGRYRWPIRVFVACVIAAGSTWATASFIKSRQYNRQLKDLAIVENLDAYLHGSDLELMRQLAANREWQQMVDASREIRKTPETTIDSITHVSSTPVAQREAMIANLPLEKRAELKSRWERFKRLDPRDRDRVRDTADAVADQSDASDLLQTMNTYALWRESIPSTELRDKIQSKDPKIRSDAIFVAIRYTQHEFAEQSSNTLDEETVERIYYVLRQIVSQRVEQGGADMKKAFERIRKISGDKDPIDTVLRMVFLPSELSNDLFGDQPPDPLTESEMEWIRLILPSEAMETLNAISGGYPLTETMTLHIWAEEAVRRRYRPKTETTLERYQSLDPAQREVMDLLPPQEILEKLTE